MTTPPPAAVPDPADVEKAARAIWEDGLSPSPYRRKPWGEILETTREKYRRMAVAALAAVRPSPDSEADRLDPVCADCEDHGDGSYTCDPERSACPHARRQQGNDALKQRAKALLAPARAEMDSIRAALGTGDREGQ